MWMRTARLSRQVIHIIIILLDLGNMLKLGGIGILVHENCNDGLSFLRSESDCFNYTNNDDDDINNNPGMWVLI